MRTRRWLIEVATNEASTTQHLTLQVPMLEAAKRPGEPAEIITYLFVHGSACSLLPRTQLRLRCRQVALQLGVAKGI